MISQLPCVCSHSCCALYRKLSVLLQSPEWRPSEGGHIYVRVTGRAPPPSGSASFRSLVCWTMCPIKPWGNRPLVSAPPPAALYSLSLQCVEAYSWSCIRIRLTYTYPNIFTSLHSCLCSRICSRIIEWITT